MRHRVHGKKLNRDSEHRRAMLRNLAAGVFEHGAIETTMPKAKAVQPFVEQIITIARQGTFTARRRIEAMLNDRKVFAWVADPNVGDEHKVNPYFDLPDADQIEFNRYGDVRKVPRLVQHILTTVAPLFADRPGGYTRIVKLGKRRLGDGTDLVRLELVGVEDGPQLSGGISRRRQQADNRTAFAAKLRKAGGGDESAATATAVVAAEEPIEEEATAIAPEPAAEDADTGDAAPEADEEKKED